MTTSDADASPAHQSDPAASESVPSPLRRPEVRVLIVSRAATAIGLTTLSYGAMVYLAQIDASQLTVSIVGATRYLAAVLFGVQGGIVADTTSKRTALLVGYTTMAALCLLIPMLLGAGVPTLLLLVFSISIIGQIVAPALKASVALVATAAEVAAVAAILSIAGGLGTAAGAAFLAPLLITLGGIRLVMYAAGVILAVGALRTAKLPGSEGRVSMATALRQAEWKQAMPSRRKTAQWILEHRTVAVMTLVGAVVVALFDGLNSLMPVYVRDVLGSNPANTVFIFAPGGLGFLAGILLGPRLMTRYGERPIAAVGLTATAIGSVLFGIVDRVAPIVAPFSPLRLLTLLGAELSPSILAAGFIAIPFSLGSTMAGASVQTYINRRVPLDNQGSVFGMQEMVENALTLTAILAFGLIATMVGSRFVFVIAPPLLVVIVIWLIRDSYTREQQPAPSRRVVMNAMLRPPTEPLAPGDAVTQPGHTDQQSR